MPQGKEKITVQVAVKGKKKVRPAKTKTVVRVAAPKVKALTQKGKKKAVSRTMSVLQQQKQHLPAQRRLGMLSEKRQLSAILEAISLPREAEPIKLGTSKYGGDPSGACNPWEQRSVMFNTLPVGNADYTRTNVCFGFRSLLRANVYSYIPAGTVNYRATDKLEIAPGSWQVFNPGALVCISPSSAPHGQYLFAGRHGLSDVQRGFWADGGTDFQVSSPVAGLPAGGLAVKFKRSNGREWIDIIQGQILPGGNTPGRFQSSTLPSGYYSFEIGFVDPARSQAVAQFYTVTVDYTWNSTTNVCYGHLSVPDVENQFGAIDAVRMTALSLMVTNNSAAIQKQGTLCGVQFDKGTTWTESIDFQHFTSNRKAKLMPSDNGMYGFLKPMQEEDFDLLSEFVRASEGETTEKLSVFPSLSDAAFLIIPDTSYIGVAFDVNKPSGVFPTGVTAYWTRAFGIEFITNDQWRSLTRSTLSPEIVELALHLISELPQWHENEFHISDLWEGIKSFASRVANGIMEYGPSVIKGATMLAPLLL